MDLAGRRAQVSVLTTECPAQLPLASLLWAQKASFPLPEGFLSVPNNRHCGPEVLEN